MTLGPFATSPLLSHHVLLEFLKDPYWHYSCLCSMLFWLKINVLFSLKAIRTTKFNHF